MSNLTVFATVLVTDEGDKLINVGTSDSPLTNTLHVLRDCLKAGYFVPTVKAVEVRVVELSEAMLPASTTGLLDRRINP